MTDLSGKSINRYRIIELLGEGGMARVYRARDTRLERDVAFKIIRTEVFPPAILQTTLKRFEREAKALARISHANIVNIFDYGDNEGAPFLVMEFLAGGTLREKLGKPVPFRQAASYIIPIAQALAYAHSENVIHRDVKPANILFTHRGIPKLSDFGIAKLFGLQESVVLTGSNIAIGTPAYMAPEQWIGKTSPASDIYALGVVFYELLTGELPYHSDTPGGMLAQVLTQPLPDARSIVPDLPEAVSDTLATALAKTPEERFSAMSEFAQVLENMAAWTEPENKPKQTQIPTVIEPQVIGKDIEETIEESSFRVGAVKTQDQLESAEITTSTKPEKSAISRHKITRWSSMAVLILALMLTTIYIGSNFFGASQEKTTTQEPTPMTQSAQIVGLVSFTQTAQPSQTVITTTKPTIKSAASSTSTPTIKLSASTTPTQVSAIKVTPSPTPLLPQITDPKGISLVLIPAGSFVMGRGEQPNEGPAHTLYLDAFYIDVYEVTNSRYAECVEAKVCPPPTQMGSKNHSFYFNEPLYANYPVIYVDWNAADTYCKKWRGGRLPTEAEWEKSARGGLAGMYYPWGNDEPVCIHGAINGANFGRCSAQDPIAVGSFAPNGYGLYDMAGNVHEWVADWYQYDYYSSFAPNDWPQNPTGPLSGVKHVLRGGDWGGYTGHLMVTSRWIAYSNSDTSAVNMGFRCALSP